MGAYNIRISDLANEDIRAIAAYIKHELNEFAIAEKTIEAILGAIVTLEDMPMRVGLVRDERLAERRIRSLHVKNYSVFFRINETMQTVEVIRILYSRRDWASLI